MRTNNYFLVLDIETSTETAYDNKLQKEVPISVWLTYGVCKLYNLQGETKLECKFRKWETLHKFLCKVSLMFRKKGIFCYVHNLSYEFDFLIKNLSKPKKFTCNSSHKVISAILESYNIEFRCTYQLSAKSLRKIGNELNFIKLDSEYRMILPHDNVTEEEWEYCVRDCDIVAQYIIKEELPEYIILNNIPYTSTGKVRKDFKELLKQYPPEDNLWDIEPPENCFYALSKAFKGAITMSNPRYTNIIIHGRIKSFDETSKYPSIMMCKEYPYTIEKQENFTKEDIKNNKFWIAKIKFQELTSKFDFGFLSIYNTEYINLATSDIFNGKIINAREVEMYITNIDFDSINLIYTYNDFEILEFYPLKKYSKLPKAFFELIKKYAQPKYELKKKLKIIEKEKGENSEEYIATNTEYMKSKNKLNSIYGMMVQKLTNPEYYIDDNYLWHEKENNYKIKNKKLNRNFLYGIYITAYSRYDLLNNIVKNCPNTFVYCDTDSIKFIDTGNEFIDMNDYIYENVRDLPYFNNFNRFDYEGYYTEFLTYGAKKYAYVKDGEFGYTVAGLPKHINTIKSFDDFKLGTTYKDCKLAKRYIYQGIAFDFDAIDENELKSVSNLFDLIGDFENKNDIKTSGGVALFNSDYTLNMTKSDLLYIERNKSIWERKNIQQNILI